jgi:hypothetical protein
MRKILTSLIVCVGFVGFVNLYCAEEAYDKAEFDQQVLAAKTLVAQAELFRTVCIGGKVIPSEMVVGLSALRETIAKSIEDVCAKLGDLAKKNEALGKDLATLSTNRETIAKFVVQAGKVDESATKELVASVASVCEIFGKIKPYIDKLERKGLLRRACCNRVTLMLSLGVAACAAILETGNILGWWGPIRMLGR